MSTVGVLAAHSSFGDQLVEHLRSSPAVASCERLGPDGPVAQGRFDTLVCAPGQDPSPGVRDRLLSLLAGASPHRVVGVGSAAIYGASHHNAGRLRESAFIDEARSEVVRAWAAFEASLRRAAPGAALTLLRPAAVLDGSGYFSRLLSRRVAVTYPGHDPTIQLLDPTDLAGAVRRVVESGVAGTFNVAPAAGIPLTRALQAAGIWRLPIPRVPQTGVRTLLAPAGVATAPAQLDYIRFSWTVSGDRLRREAGFEPSFTSAQAVARFTGRSVPTAAFDEYGMDPDYIHRYCGHLFQLLHEWYWRVEVRGLEHVPRNGPGVLVGMHRGFMPFDGVMALYALVRHVGRIPRFLIHPSLTKFPFLADFMARLGGVMACVENGEWVLQRGELLGVFPEGIRGAFTMYERAYRLGRFGRDEFVRMALRNRAPLLPFVTVGSAEIYPILRRVDWNWFKRYTEWPFLPITPTPIPLPSKWHTQFLEPMHIEREYPPEAADDPATVGRISAQVRRTMQAAVDRMRARRRSIFHGSIFEGAGA